MYLTYSSRMMECRRDGYEEGISIGLEQGAYQNKLETARKLIARSYSPEEIADISGLTIYQVQSLLVDSEQP